MMAATPSPKVIEGRDDFPKGFATNALASYAESPPPCGWLKMTAVFLGLMRSPCLASSLSRAHGESTTWGEAYVGVEGPTVVGARKTETAQTTTHTC